MRIVSDYYHELTRATKPNLKICKLITLSKSKYDIDQKELQVLSAFLT